MEGERGRDRRRESKGHWGLSHPKPKKLLSLWCMHVYSACMFVEGGGLQNYRNWCDIRCIEPKVEIDSRCLPSEEMMEGGRRGEGGREERKGGREGGEGGKGESGGGGGGGGWIPSTFS